ncbi:hypothetical protein B1729_15015 [Microbacterium sp. B35-04]|uniref:hypothetical protein n=1 Tax=unclassified Microbacterium TaxID=2609290 RepID=UPI0013CF4985|nr:MULTISPECIES: hypothetical protein [unclassified Microbacterium]KAF2412468.1 hypothetical protein B1729_15015 [Microbacterium sp. B35-04]KAF2417868.1 hypothetical protein B2K11_10830 [Microbacterium sp. B35-30]
MFAVYAAEQQYRHDTWTREREHALLTAIRERKIAASERMPTVRAPRPAQVAWPRPIGLHTADERTTVCAVA